MKNTLILGATTNKERYAYLAAELLTKYHHPIVPVGIKSGVIFGREIINTKVIQPNIDTITLYIGPHNQPEWYEYILATKPQRVIFNPGTENPELEHILEQHNIPYIEACTLVLLHTNQY
jgi:predicted CoA-binding protein